MASVTVPASRGLLRRPTATTGFWSWLTTVDHKKIGIMYGVSAFAFFLIGGLEALLIRSQLARPDRRRQTHRRERRVTEPSALRRAAKEERRVDEQTAEEERPVRERVQPWERDVTRTDHQRDQVVEERGAERHHDEEDHRDAVHREDLVVLLGRQDVTVRMGELEADQQRLAPTDEEERERRDAVEDADALVVDGGDPAPEALGFAGSTEDRL